MSNGPIPTVNRERETDTKGTYLTRLTVLTRQTSDLTNDWTNVSNTHQLKTAPAQPQKCRCRLLTNHKDATN